MSLLWDESLKGHKDRDKLRQDLRNFEASLPLRLYFDQGALKLESKDFKNIYCDFTKASYIKEVRQNYARSENIFSFLKKKKSLNICDLTVGMGRDFFKFVLAGHRVIGFERHPLVYHLVRDGLERFNRSNVKEDLKRIFKREDFFFDLRLGEGPGQGSYDLIYYDPMFEDSSKKAAPKKKMQLLKQLCLVSEEGEKNNILAKALEVSDQVIYKCAQKPKQLPFEIHREIKGKGFSYLIL